MKSLDRLFASPLRILIYLSIFATGAAVHELLLRLIKPTPWSDASVTLTLLTIVLFIVAGIFLSAERHTMSRVTSAATLFILGLIALRIGHAVAPDPYLLAGAFSVAVIGARPVLHQKTASAKQMLLRSSLTLLIALVVAIVFAYGMMTLDSAQAETSMKPFDLHATTKL